jgi:hypothetical protein
VQSASANVPRKRPRAGRPSPAAIAPVAAAPAQPTYAPAGPSAAPTEEAGALVTVAPQPDQAPSDDDADIEIRDGQIRKEPGHIKPTGGDVTMRLGSDEAVLVEVDDRPSLTLPAGKQVPITIDAHLAKHLDIELVRVAGKLVLRLDD